MLQTLLRIRLQNQFLFSPIIATSEIWLFKLHTDFDPRLNNLTLANDLFIAACVCARVLIMCQMLCMFVVLNFSLKHVKLRLSFEQNVILDHTSQSERHAMHSSNSFDAEFYLDQAYG
jgi:hypothetical protein